MKLGGLLAGLWALGFAIFKFVKSKTKK